MYLPAVLPSSHSSLDSIFYLLFNGVYFRARSFIFLNDLKHLSVLLHIIVGICQQEFMTKILLREVIGAPPRNVPAGLFQCLCRIPGASLEVKTEGKRRVDH